MNFSFDPEKRYSCKSNATRAARKAGLTTFECHQDEDGWFFSVPAPEAPKPTKPAKAAKKPAPTGKIAVDAATAKSKRAAALELRKDEVAPKAKAKADKEPSEKAPSGKVALILALAAREEGCTPKELNELTGWTGAPWKWLFENPKGNGWCQKWGYDFKPTKTGREVCYYVEKQS